MTELLLEYPLEEARDVVREAFRRTDGITEIEAGGHQVVGRTGISFPRVLWSYGENVYVDFSDPRDDGTVPVEVWAEKAVWPNVTADPEKYKRAFLRELETVRGRPVEDRQREPVEDRQREPVESDTGQSPSRNWIAVAVGYPVSIAVGTLVGLLFAMGTMSAILGRLNDLGGILGILAGAAAGAALWFHRETPVVRAAGTYLGLALLGVVLAGIVQTALDLGDVTGSILVLLLAGGLPSAVYVRRTRSTGSG